jgi:uncharacterized coiled-coil protein SlyX
MKVMEKQLADANQTIEELKQQIKQKDDNMTNLQKSLATLEDRVKPMEEFWKDIEAIRKAKVVKHPDGTLELKTREDDTQK